MSKIKIFALGGLNENGKNMYVVDVDEDIFVFDAGLKYDNDLNLGIDYIIPNFDYLVENKDRIVGLFITHGHDDQEGAIADLLTYLPDPSINAPLAGIMAYLQYHLLFSLIDLLGIYKCLFILSQLNLFIIDQTKS